MFDRALRDLKHAVRSLVASPGFVAVAVITLAFGIGMTATVYGLVQAVLLRPLPYGDSDSVVRIVEHPRRAGSGNGPWLEHTDPDDDVSAMLTGMLVEQSPSFAALSPVGGGGATVRAGDEVAFVPRARVGADFFNVLLTSFPEPCAPITVITI